MNKWWEPDAWGSYYWPVGLPREVTIENFIAAFGTEGFQVCEHRNVELGYQKVALYADKGKPTHMARQLPNGKWTSKLGEGWDIEHTSLEGVESAGYGKVAVLLKRPIPVVA